MILNLGQLSWQTESPSFFKLVGYDIRLRFDGALWWLYSIDESLGFSFESRAQAIGWINKSIEQLSTKGISK